MSKRIALSLLMVMLTLAMIVAFVASVEFYLRAKSQGSPHIYYPDEYAIARYQNNLSHTRTTRFKEDVELITNEFGLRAQEHQDPNDAEIVVLGDSNVAALYLDFEKTISRQISSVWGHAFKTIDISLPGYGPDQAVLRYINLVSSSSAKFLIINFFADNDFGDFFRNNILRKNHEGYWFVTGHSIVSPKLRWQKHKLLFKFLNLFQIDIEHFYYLSSFGKYYAVNVRKMGRSPKYATSPDAFKDFVDLSRSEFLNYKAGKYTSWLNDHYDYGISTDPGGEAAIYAREMLSFVLSLAKDHFTGKNECIILLIQPSEDDLKVGGAGGFDRKLASELYPTYNPKNLSDLAEKSAAIAGINSVNLYDVFSEEPEKYYYSEDLHLYDNHWNEDGIKVAVDEIVKYNNIYKCVK